MASPLSSLKKTKKTPLSSSQSSQSHTGTNIPYRHGNDSLLNEVTSRMVNKKYETSTSQGLISEPLPGAPSDIDLMQTMISRISVLEKHIQLQNKELNDKDKRISVLEDKCRLYQKMSSDECHSPAYVKELESRCLLLQQQISEMEEFLLDYGMIWVGQSYDDEDDNEGGEMLTTGGLWNPTRSVADDSNAMTTDNPYNIDFDRLIENINELNLIAGDGETKIEKTASGARFKVPDPVQLILYKNGIVMFKGPFRSYDDDTTQLCITDFMDGYFPSELQKKYPDGVPFKVIDKRDVAFKEGGKRKAFTGQGQSLGGENQPSRLVKSILNNKDGNKQSTENVESEIPGRKLTTDQFLTNLPSSVIRGGKVIDIRSSLTEKLRCSNSDSNQCPVTIVETETMQEIKDRLGLDESVRPPSGKNITTLRIKDVDNHTYVLKMKFTDNIGDIFNYLNDLRKSTDGSYDLVTTFPSKVYSDRTVNLFNAGLTPNATMHIRKKQG